MGIGAGGRAEPPASRRRDARLGRAAATAAGPSTWVVVAVSALAVVVLGVLDYASGPDVAFSILYLLPISAAAWRAGRSSGVAIGVLAAAAWAIADYVARSGEYPHPLIPIWNSFARLATFLVVVMLVSELHDRMRAQSRLATIDPLTGLANLRTFMALAQREIDIARQRGEPITLAYVDVDDFKTVNDTRGHAGGDAVLREIADRLQSNTRASDVVARMGGDEFVVMLTEVQPASAAQVLSEIGRRAADGSDGTHVGLTIGAVTQMSPDGDLEALVRCADDLMYAAKRNGKGGVKHQVIA